jgi:hypothetical protein
MAAQVKQRTQQIVFAPMQRHSASFELGIIVFCILCIILGVVIAKATDWGVTTRPESLRVARRTELAPGPNQLGLGSGDSTLAHETIGLSESSAQALQSRPRDFGEFLLGEATTKVAQRGILEAL